MAIGRPTAREHELAEAATWLARLHADDRSAADVEAFQRWLEASASHRDAFGAVTASWEIAGGLSDVPRESIAGRSRRAVLVGAGAATCALSLGAGWWYDTREPRPVTYASDVGEIRRVTLADGSRLVLDTATTASVALGAGERRVTLLSGRAHVDVARDPSRPFSVLAGERQVVARGTSFDVEVEEGGMAVLLTHGLVDVVGRDGDRTSLVPGQRLRSHSGVVRVDEPDLGREGAWRIGRLIFEDTALSDAVTEINRYGRHKIVIADGTVGGLRMSGAYATGDTRSFALSVSALLDLRLEDGADGIVLSRKVRPARSTHQT